MSVVLDASAVLAYLNAGTGQERVSAALDEAVLSAVNWAEVLQRITAVGGDADRIGDGLVALGVSVEPLTVDDARMIGHLWSSTHSAGLSVSDRACLATAYRLGLPVLTADQAWSELDLALDIHLIR
ncbi:PIN domain-containing protein [Haloactinomyces albus]|uniref:PIN domain nuclease of toxin-antitoxin system n=1 Tax=Haloactinomyces albus TaxID=1352928 RepID=A0AAE3ZCY2_9ACTN|nr:type II toxin-antitoxin system VapC family toxin [Haloactinomyces albus]MDR7301590.1 PIN domain nuclease of toxin-antitoxin system [Haloactinomyces albus]